MTPALWVFCLAQLSLILLAAALCAVPPNTARTANRLVAANTVAVVASLALSAFVVAYGFLLSFAPNDGPDSERAAQLATGITIVINGPILAVPFAIAAGALLLLQTARRREAKRAAYPTA